MFKLVGSILGAAALLVLISAIGYRAHSARPQLGLRRIEPVGVDVPDLHR